MSPMPYKKIKDMDLYEILELSKDARLEEVAEAYKAAVSAYRPHALASYGLVTEDERRFMLERIEEAYRTLKDPAARTRYDEEMLPQGLPSSPKALFRKTFIRMEIKDAEPRAGILSRLRGVFRRKNRRNDESRDFLEPKLRE